ncbi:unnamed protein product [Caenorhabditis nigoni]
MKVAVVGRGSGRSGDCMTMLNSAMTTSVYEHWQAHYEDRDCLMKCCRIPKIDPYFPKITFNATLVPKIEIIDADWPKSFKGNEGLFPLKKKKPKSLFQKIVKTFFAIAMNQKKK